MKDTMTLRPFNINDAETILSWCKDKYAFRLWSADRYKDFPAQPEEMMERNVMGTAMNSRNPAHLFARV